MSDTDPSDRGQSEVDRNDGARPAAGSKGRVIHVTTTDMSLDWLLGPQLRAFADAGYEVIGASAPGPHVEALEADGIRHEAVTSLTRSTSVRHDLIAFVDLWKLFRRLRPDIVHTHNPKPGILGRVAARLAGVPLIVNTQHGLYAQPTDRRRRRWPVYAAERAAAAFGHVELVQNEEDVDVLTDTLRIPERRVRLLGNGVDLDRFDPDAVSAEARAELRREWGIGDDEIVCGVVSRLVREKGIVELLAAAALLREPHPNVRLLVIGPNEPDKSDAVDSAAVDRARADGVVFAGQRSDMPDCYAAMAVFATASWREGMPRCAMEASAMALPVVATDIRGNRQVVDDDVTGLLVPVRDPHALADAIGSLAGDAERRLAFGQAGCRRAHDEFDQQRVIDQTLAVYDAGPAAGRR